MSELKPCPCGKIPETLAIETAYDRDKWGYVCGDCCGQWEIEFKTNYLSHGDPDLQKIAANAWNSAPRAQPEVSKIQLAMLDAMQSAVEDVTGMGDSVLLQMDVWQKLTEAFYNPEDYKLPAPPEKG